MEIAKLTRVTINPEKLAFYGLTVPKVVNILRNENASISAGDIEEGKRKYIVGRRRNANY